MSDRIGRTGLQAAPAAWAEAQRCFHLLVAGDVDRTEHGGEQHAWPKFRREQLQIEPERAEACFDRGMRQRQQRRLMPVGVTVIAPGIDMGRRHDDRRVAVVFEPIDQFERRFFQARERKLIVVVFVAVVPGGDARAAAAHALGQHDHPAAVEIGDIGRPPGIARIGRMALQRSAVGNADQVGAERTRLLFDIGRAERLLERGDH